ncbi:helix-turn-helix domain-containing protein [Streptomyces hokutonensis]|uniref:helix-turn-helix domain-containing protein n=1 Tax=Streptomyces hokutonensis TaxID=1306990 RepID=UPI003F5406A7
MDHTFDRPSLGAFLRTRRAALQPEDVGLRRGPRRRAPGLRREEVAELCTMSADYFARLERGDGPQPSEQMVAAIARGLRLTPDERDHLFLLAGYRTAGRDLRVGHVSPGLMRVMDGLAGTTAQVMGPLGETLPPGGPRRQQPYQCRAVALGRHPGRARFPGGGPGGRPAARQ